MNPQSTPHSREAEEATIGAVLINPDVLVELHFLKSEDFFIIRHGFIWDALNRLSEKRQPIDLLTVTDELDKIGKLNDVCGSAYLTSLLTQVPTSVNAVSYARIVEENSIRRKLIQAGTKIVQAAYSDNEISQVQEMANKVVNDATIRDESDERPLQSALSKVYDRAANNAERLQRGEPINVGLTTGFKDLDLLLLGIEEEESVIVAGRPGDGKTAFLFNVASHVSIGLGKRVAIFSQEMSNEEVARRLVSEYAEIDSQKIKTGSMDEYEWARFTNAIEALEQSNVFISDSTNLTPSKLRAICLQLKRSQGLDLVIVDYLQLMNAGMKMENRTREVGYVSRQIKMLTKELHTPIFSACQLSREVEKRADKRPILSDLREAGDIEQDANTVMFLYRPNKDDPKAERKNVTEVIVAKRRDGAIGSKELIFNPAITKFRDAYTTNFNPNEREEARRQHTINSSVGSED